MVAVTNNSPLSGGVSLADNEVAGYFDGRVDAGGSVSFIVMLTGRWVVISKLDTGFITLAEVKIKAG